MENQVDKILDDHEKRIRFLETTGTETKMELLSIKNSQADLKLTVMEGNKETNNNLTKLLNKFVDNEIHKDKTDNQNKWNLTFKVWAVIGPILAAVAAYFMN